MNLADAFTDRSRRNPVHSKFALMILCAGLVTAAIAEQLALGTVTRRPIQSAPRIRHGGHGYPGPDSPASLMTRSKFCGGYRWPCQIRDPTSAWSLQNCRVWVNDDAACATPAIA